MIYCDSYLSLNHTVLRDNRGIRGGDKRGKGVEMRGNGGGRGRGDMGVMISSRYEPQRVGGGLLSLELWMSLLYTISLRIPWNILEGSMTFHGLP